MAADAHGDCLGYSGAHHIADGASAKIVEKAAQVLMHEKQLVGMPGWAENDRWDVEGVVVADGKPNREQLQSLVRKLLVERFGLHTHTEKRDSKSRL